MAKAKKYKLRRIGDDPWGYPVFRITCGKRDIATAFSNGDIVRVPTQVVPEHIERKVAGIFLQLRLDKEWGAPDGT